MANDEWRTPPLVFKDISLRMGVKFTLDPCTTPDNPLGTEHFYTKKDDGLKQCWGGEFVFMNPGYSRGVIDKWVAKAKLEAGDCDVVGLLPLRTARWFRKYILDGGEILHNLADWEDIPYGGQGIFFYESRVRFIDPITGLRAESSPTWDTVIVVWV